MIKKIYSILAKHLSIILFILIILFIFRNLVLNIRTSFINWDDTSFISWQIFTTRDKLVNLDFKDLYTTNSHYPYKNSLFFTDTFLGQSVMAIPLYFIKNPVLLYNILFLVTIFLNYLATYLLFKRIFKSKLSGFIGAFFLNNSFFFFDQLIHLQTMSYWPVIFMLYFLFDLHENKPQLKSTLLAGVMLSIQFYMAVYLGIFSAFIFAIYCFTYVLNILINRFNLKSLFSRVLHLAIITIVFFILTYPILIKNYREFEKTYHAVRDTNEILNTSTHATDYLFFMKGTLLSKLKPVQTFNSFNKHKPAEQVYFPGFILLFGFIAGLLFNKIKYDKVNQRIVFTSELKAIDFFFIFLFLVGFVFSLGPRLNANGKYLEIPLPYLVFLNQLDVLHSIRLTHRWVFLLIIALIYFSIKFYTKLKKPILIAVLAFFVIESIPLNLKFSNRQYIDAGYKFLKTVGHKNEILMEFPFLNLEEGRGPDYETMNLLASTYHNLTLINGYTGLFLNEQSWLKIYLEKSFPSGESDTILKNLNIKYLKINKKYLTKDRIDKTKNYYKDSILYEDQNTLIINNRPYPIIQDIPNKVDSKFKKDGTIYYGIDKIFYLNLIYTNKTNELITNVNQNKITLKLKFYKNNHLTYEKEYYDLHPLVLYGKDNKLSTLSFIVKERFNKVDFTMYNEKNQIIDHYSTNL